MHLRKNNRFTLFTFLFVIGACSGGFEAAFEMNTFFTHPFPKKGVNMKRVLGQEFTIFDDDSLTYEVFYDGKTQKTTIMKKGYADTLLDAKICRYRGNYYVNHRLEKRNEYIFISAFRVGNSGIQGLKDFLPQSFKLNDHFETLLINPDLKEQFPLADTILEDKKIILLHNDKKQIKALFDPILDSLPIYNTHFGPLPIKVDTPEEFEEIEADDTLKLSIYPNPAKNYVMVDANVVIEKVQLIDLNTLEIVFEGGYPKHPLRIDLDSFRDGTYSLKATSSYGVSSTRLVIKK